MSSNSALRRIAPALALAAALSLAACSQNATPGGPAPSSSGGDQAPVSNGAAQVKVELTNAGGDDACTVDHLSAAAGPVTFTVSNTGATAITEFEVLSDQRILGEKENLAPGLPAVNFTLTLEAGNYQVYCPGAGTETQTFTVTGTAPSRSGGSAQSLLTEGTKGYATYVAGVLDDMNTAVANLQTAVNSGDVADAKAKYALARPFYEKVESDVEGFVVPGHKATDNRYFLDYLVDMRASNLDPKVGWHGFHAIERDLWQRGAITGDTKKLAAELTANVKSLSTLAASLEYKPEDLANGAAGLLEEVQTNKIKGEEELYSHLDLTDFAANVEGAQQAFAYLKPGLEVIDPALTKQVAAQFDAVDRALQKYRDPKQAGGYVLWTPQLRAKDAASLSKTVQGLQDPLSRIGEKVATA